MPGDTLHINNKVTAKNTYDAIVVGSVVVGALKKHCDKGLKVLLLDRGKNVVHPDYPTATRTPWEFPHGGKLTMTERSQKYVQRRHSDGLPGVKVDIENSKRFFKSSYGDWYDSEIIDKADVSKQELTKEFQLGISKNSLHFF